MAQDRDSSVKYPLAGIKDRQTVSAGGGRSAPPKIAGVVVMELSNVLTRSGSLLEVFRTDWESIRIRPQQVNWVELNPAGVTDWHCHLKQADHLVAVGGTIKVALWDNRVGSATRGESEVIRMGALRPTLVIIPPGVWHGIRNLSGQPAGYLNVTNHCYDYPDPDNWRLEPGASGIPDIL